MGSLDCSSILLDATSQLSIYDIIFSRSIFTPPGARPRLRSISHCEEEKEEAGKEVRVNGAEYGDIPYEYIVKDLHQGELPVIGTYVSPRILPGFQYKIRILTTDRWLFDGRSVCVKAIGYGYGKRISTTRGHFYSDTHVHGLGFRLTGALTTTDKILVSDDSCRPIGAVTVTCVSQELEVPGPCPLTKQVQVTWCGVLDLATGQHGLRSLVGQLDVQLTSQIQMIKDGGRHWLAQSVPGIPGLCHFLFTV